MNRPLAFICLCIIAVGVLTLGRCTFLTVVYGHGNMEAGNFHRCVYWTERDAATGKLSRCWDTDWRLVSGTEGSPLAQALDIWFIGIAFVVAGAAIYVIEGRRP
jgi:hypothetical protein